MKFLGTGLMALSFLPLGAYATAINVDLGMADSFAVLAGSTVTNTDTPTIVHGNLGVWMGSAITGFPPGIVIGGATHAAEQSLCRLRAL